jgi:hypothetical protein
LLHLGASVKQPSSQVEGPIAASQQAVLEAVRAGDERADKDDVEGKEEGE